MVRKSFDERCHSEGTRDAIFLFQWNSPYLHKVPEGCFVDEEGDVIFEFQRGHEFPTPLTDLQLKDRECMIDRWITDGVFLTREEGEAYGRRREYNYKHGWRVYCVPAEGELAELLRET